jgi:hypothetical protein
MTLEVTSGTDSSLVVKITLDAQTAVKLLQNKPRSLATATFCAYIIEQYLTGAARVPAYCVGAGHTGNLQTEQIQPTPARPVHDDVSEQVQEQAEKVSAPEKKLGCQTIEHFFGEGVGKESEETPREPLSLVDVPPAKSIRKHVRREYTPEFQAFWNMYQKAPIKANSQSKPLAFEAWKEAIKSEAPERITEAATRAVEQCKQAKLTSEWCAPLPDAFRWLRDERYAVLLEDHVPAGPQTVGGYVIYD